MASFTAGSKEGSQETEEQEDVTCGSSAGTEDYTYQAVADVGEILVHGVSMMPGMPTLRGAVDGQPVIGSPGSPVSAVLSFEQFVAPLLAGLGAALVAWPLAALPLITTAATTMFGIGTGLGTRNGVRLLKSGEPSR